MQILFFLAFVFHALLVNAMNSTENRQLLVSESSSITKNRLDELELNAIRGDNVSSKAYKTYLDMVKGDGSCDTYDQEVCKKLIEFGLCQINEFGLVIAEYHMSDEIRAHSSRSKHKRK